MLCHWYVDNIPFLILIIMRVIMCHSTITINGAWLYKNNCDLATQIEFRGFHAWMKPHLHNNNS